MRIAIIAALALVAMGSVAMGSSAVAQVATSMPRPTPDPLGADRVKRELWAKEMADRKRRNSPERKARAERAAAMINAGQCPAAYKMAVDEEDTEMATMILRSCAPAAQAQAQAPAQPPAQ